jgi:membrane protein implicated in regulation of membrane protease activity
MKTFKLLFAGMTARQVLGVWFGVVFGLVCLIVGIVLVTLDESAVWMIILGFASALITVLFVGQRFVKRKDEGDTDGLA